MRPFHLEGFVNQFASDTDGGKPRFTSESIENIREGYRARDVRGDVETFGLAATGKEFEVYTETRFTRRIR